MLSNKTRRDKTLDISVYSTQELIQQIKDIKENISKKSFIQREIAKLAAELIKTMNRLEFQSENKKTASDLEGVLRIKVKEYGYNFDIKVDISKPPECELNS